MAVKKKRQMKLQPRHRQLRWGIVKVVPELRLNGNWLADHGFKAGDHVEITVKENELVIKPAN